MHRPHLQGNIIDYYTQLNLWRELHFLLKWFYLALDWCKEWHLSHIIPDSFESHYLIKRDWYQEVNEKGSGISQWGGSVISATRQTSITDLWKYTIGWEQERAIIRHMCKKKKSISNNASWYKINDWLASCYFIFLKSFHSCFITFASKAVWA